MEYKYAANHYDIFVKIPTNLNEAINDMIKWCIQPLYTIGRFICAQRRLLNRPTLIETVQLKILRQSRPQFWTCSFYFIKMRLLSYCLIEIACIAILLISTISPMGGTRTVFCRNKESNTEKSDNKLIQKGHIIDVPIYCAEGYRLDVRNQCQEVWEEWSCPSNS